MTQVIAIKTKSEVGRPLHILVPLVKEDIQNAEEAGMPFYIAAGEKLHEAKQQLRHGHFVGWLKRNFDFSPSTANRWMKLAEHKVRAHTFSSQREFARATNDLPQSAGTSKISWQEPVQQILGRVDLNTLRDAELKRADEREAVRKLKLQLIDIGYKALATKLHPDKGGSREAMARLNQARDQLKASI